MSSNYNILITGANRGLGLGLLELYLAAPNNTIIAAVRDPKAQTSQALQHLPTGANSRVILVKIDSIKKEDPAAAVQVLQKQYSIEHLDLVIANAGISQDFPYIADLKIGDLEKHLEVNVYGVVWLFQAVLPLLLKAQAPKWVAMSSTAGSLGDMGKMVHPNSAYGASKAVLNFHTLKIHYEHPEIMALAMSPGFVQTEMGNSGAVKLGLEKAFITVEESVNGMKKVLDAVTKETHGGKFVSFDGGEVAW